MIYYAPPFRIDAMQEYQQHPQEQGVVYTLKYEGGSAYSQNYPDMLAMPSYFCAIAHKLWQYRRSAHGTKARSIALSQRT